MTRACRDAALSSALPCLPSQSTNGCHEPAEAAPAQNGVVPEQATVERRSPRNAGLRTTTQLKLLELQAYRHSAWAARLLMQVREAPLAELEAQGGPLAVAVSRLGAHRAEQLLHDTPSPRGSTAGVLERQIFSVCTTIRRLAHYAQCPQALQAVAQAQVLSILLAQPWFEMLESGPGGHGDVLQEALRQGAPLHGVCRPGPATEATSRALALQWGADATLEQALARLHAPVEQVRCEHMTHAEALVRAAHWALEAAYDPVRAVEAPCASANPVLQRLRERGLDPVSAVMQV